MTRRVLVVDDEPDIRELVVLSLLTTDWSVTTAASGEEALRLCSAGEVDVVLLDVDMPGMDGRQTAVALLADPRAGVEVVFLTASADVEGLPGPVVPKPFDPVRLAAQVEALVSPWVPPPATPV
ncbi:response regulator [Lentzea sp.]|uniref:response regulator n=1 Tax=Lentzea sp. TaxID=56099 RepID=UPI002ED6B18B